MKKSQTFLRLQERLSKKNKLIQVILGPRQVGKTTSILSFLKNSSQKSQYFTAEEANSLSPAWIESAWQKCLEKKERSFLVIDEIQKIPQWSTTVKKLWDRQQRENKHQIDLVLLGSSSLQIQKDLNESLTGRFEIIPAYHWGYQESADNFDLSFENYLQFGGYPGSYPFLNDKKRFSSYLRSSIIDTVIEKDILHFSRVKSPALFRQTFSILSSYPAQDISYTKLLGQLQDRGNTDLIKSYISLFEGAFLMRSIQKYARKPHLTKSSSPKIIMLAQALIDQELDSAENRGRLFENLVGSELLKAFPDVWYWRDGNLEVDFVVHQNKVPIAIEVKSGRRKSPTALNEFSKSFTKSKKIFITPENFLIFSADPPKFLTDFSA